MIVHILGWSTVSAQVLGAGFVARWLWVSGTEPIRRAVPAAKVMLLDNLSSGSDFVGPI